MSHFDTKSNVKKYSEEFVRQASFYASLSPRILPCMYYELTSKQNSKREKVDSRWAYDRRYCSNPTEDLVRQSSDFQKHTFRLFDDPEFAQYLNFWLKEMRRIGRLPALVQNYTESQDWIP